VENTGCNLPIQMPATKPAVGSSFSGAVNATAVFGMPLHFTDTAGSCMECATRQNAVFKRNLHDDREKAARLPASNAQLLRGVALRTQKTANSIREAREMRFELQRLW